MMSLIARAPSTLSSSASESPGKRSYESQSPWSAKAEEYDRTVKPVVGRDTNHAPGHHKRFVKSSYSASYSGWDDDKALFSEEWKADELMVDRTETPVVCPRARTPSFNHVSLVNTSTLFLKKKKITIERRNPLFALNEEQGHNNSSLGTTKQNWICR